MKRNIRRFPIGNLPTGLLLAVALLLSITVLVQADLPPRHETPPLAVIELYAPAAPLQAWTVVQWQDALGEWHTVEGWQGPFNEEYRIRWWLGEEHFGEGPFRWVLYESQGGEVVLISQSFDMPAHRNEVTLVEILSLSEGNE